MTTALILSNLFLWLAVLGLAFFLVGTLRSLGLVNWQIAQLQATTPSKIGRSGLAVGKGAPGFTLPSVDGGDVSLAQFAGRKVLLILVQAGCGPCAEIVPELNRLIRRERDLAVLVINH